MPVKIPEIEKFTPDFEAIKVVPYGEQGFPVFQLELTPSSLLSYQVLHGTEAQEITSNRLSPGFLYDITNFFIKYSDLERLQIIIYEDNISEVRILDFDKDFAVPPTSTVGIANLTIRTFARKIGDQGTIGRIIFKGQVCEVYVFGRLARQAAIPPLEFHEQVFWKMDYYPLRLQQQIFWEIGEIQFHLLFQMDKSLLSHNLIPDISLQNHNFLFNALPSHNFIKDIIIQNHFFIKDITLQNHYFITLLLLSHNQLQDLILASHNFSSDLILSNHNTIQDLILISHSFSAADVTLSNHNSIQDLTLQQHNSISDLSLSNHTLTADITLQQHNQTTDITLQQHNQVRDDLPLSLHSRFTMDSLT